ncbi:MAG: hypothetical protein QOK43_1922 [Acidimicrobiaceae bacterium]|nr:hypothetical protein [Acidimicrobiaceae bacterium]
MIEPVFSEWLRTDGRPAHHGEPLSGFLDRVDQMLFARVRALINEWVARLPDEAAADIAARLRSPLDDVFRSAFWELYVHELLVRCGFSIEIHPSVHATTKVPDFKAVRQGLELFVEATVASTAAETRASDARTGVAYDELNKIDSPNYFLWVDIDSSGPAAPPLRQLRTEVELWLKTLDPDDVLASVVAAGTADAMPRLRWAWNGWAFTIGAYPKSRSARGIAGIRPVGIYGSGEAEIIDDRGPLLRRMRRKASRYGDLPLPYVIAVSGSTFTTNETDLVDALFGSDAVRVGYALDGTVRAQSARRPDGLWRRAGGVGAANVSAVLFVPYIEPWEVAKKAPLLVHHPGAARPLAIDCEFIWIGEVRNGELEWRKPRRPICDLFSLSDNWPGPEGPFEGVNS